MTWFKVDDKSAFHRKVVDAGNEAWGAFCRAGAWCSEHLTDGALPWSIAVAIAPRRVWRRLISAGLCEGKVLESLSLHDFGQWNPSAEEVRAERARKVKNIRDLRARRNRKVTAPVTGRVTGYNTGVSPARNHGPDPDPDPGREKEEAEGARVVVDRICAELATHESLRPIAGRATAAAIAKRFETSAIAKGTKLDWVLEAIGECAADTPLGLLLPEALAKKLRSYCDNAKPPRRPIADAPIVTESLDERATRKAQEQEREAYRAHLASKGGQ